MANVFLNGKFIGTHENPKKLVSEIKEMRRDGRLPLETNVSYYEDEDSVYILADKGRARRPLIVVKNGKSLLTKEHIEKLKKNEITWDDLVKEGVIEYLDAEEEENAYIAVDEKDLTPEHTHLEISPTIIMGPQANMVPYGQNSLSYRITLGAKMTKQALGLYAANLPLRADTDVSIIHYPQVPIVKTQMYDLLKFEDHPVGQNVVVAIMPFDGYNIHDAVVINKASIDRGLFRATTYKPYKCEELRYPGGQTDIITVPDKDVKGYRTEHAYRYLEEDGIVYPEVEVSAGDVLVGKVSPPRFLSSLEELRVGTEAQRETSTALAHGEKGIVESVLISESEEGNKFVKVKVRDERIPELGDKFASRHGQKGVIGLIVPEEDMPFTEEGIVPDIIFSPHSIPTRMTVSHLIEVLAGKVGALEGKYIDATAFQSVSEFELRKMLKEAGFREDGTEVMYDGRTGKRMKARIFVGSQYYYRLKHMVANKIHARSRGPVQLLTRQPTEGRAKEGGLRLGEMEKDCFIGHGAALLLKERFDSDRTVVPVCKKCGLIAIYNKFKNKTICPVCGEDAPVDFVEMAYAFKLLLDELKSMCIYPKLDVKPKFEVGK
ncbi:MAG: DNA-directed RNA polymerase subunit B [Nanoarchaeota archaeon]|nr:DNA-directed RNA polymerase subunit B [Nanoarchaeota archaeon]